MKTRDQFLALIQSARFFENVGNAASENGVLALSSLAPWGDEANASDADNCIADKMNWLPTSRDQDDPFYPTGIHSGESVHESELVRSYRMEVHKAVLARLRNVEVTKFSAGANSFSEAAKGAAAYAFRNAATEVARGIEGKWLEVADVYFKGHWPCGVTEEGKLVVF